MPPASPHIDFPDDRSLDLSIPLVMGILNVTPDSFSDGGDFVKVESAVVQARKMIEDGAGILDVGGESSRPGAEPVPADEEIRRVAPVIEAIRKFATVPISIDTCKAEVARRAIEAGADIINDISALRFDSKMAEVAAKTKAPVILMHMLGTPRTMQENPQYTDVVREINEFFDERITYAVSQRIARDKLILDPGIGFGKRPIDNVTILSRLKEFHRHNLPLLVGASRKSFIGVLDSGAPVDHRLGGSLAAAVWAAINGAAIIRVHDVRETMQALKVLKAVDTK